MKKILRAIGPVTALSVALVSLAVTATAEVDVQTLGGGRLTSTGHDYGSANGNTYTNAQFNQPWSTTLDSTGTMYMADRLNNEVRKITVPGDLANSQTTSYITGLNAPLGVLCDSSDNLYVLTSDNVVRKYNNYKNLMASNYLGSVSGPSAMTLAPNGTSLYVCYTSGVILEVYQNGTTRTVLSGCGTMHGIGVLPSGEIVVSLYQSSSFSNAIVVCATNNPNPAAPNVRVLAGNNGQGFTDGAPNFAQFNSPYGLAVTADGRVVVADRLNHRVRIVDGAGVTSTLYGCDPSKWNPNYFPGWSDGDATTNAAREPVSVTISTNGFVYTTEVYYHILREVIGSGLTTGTTGGPSGTNTVPVTVTPPSFTPNCGYFPQCTTITVTSSSGNVYYTMDGTEPTTNSFYVATPNGTGTFTWCNSTNALTSLKMKAFIGTNSSVTVSGQSCGDNEIGFTRDITAGIGSTAVIPVVVNLQSNGVLKSVQFRVEVTPWNGTPDIVPSLQLLSISTNDFVPLVGPGNGPVTFQSFPYTTPSNGRGMVISALGSGSGFSVKDRAVVALLAVQLPGTCSVGQSYKLDILYPSGTSDGAQADVPLNSMTSHYINVQNVQYLVGDSSPGRWYSAGEFGDGTLANSDVNNALYASVGIRVPYAFSDAFDAMDAFPETPGGQIGDGFITFLDWQHILKRSVGIETNNWLRSWSTGGVRTHQSTTLVLTPHAPIQPNIGTPGNVWLREAYIGSSTIGNVIPGNYVTMPVYAKVGAGYSLAGLQFRATLVSDTGAPDPVGGITFNPGPNMTGTQILPGQSPTDLVCAWSIGTLPTSLTGSNYLGYIGFSVPAGVAQNQVYTLRFSYVDGAPDLNTFYQLESFPGSLTVMAPAATPSKTSDEWKTHFFGSTTNALAADNVDADGDGVCNWKEYLAGTDPTSAASCLHVATSTSTNGTTLTWLSAPGKTYVIESATSILATTWTSIGTVLGDGTVLQVTEPNNGTAQFYRIRLQP